MIDPTARIDTEAKLAADVEVGAFTIIGPDVEIGAGTRIGSHVAIEGPTRIGPNNDIHAFCSIGSTPQDKKFREDERTALEIGSGNTIREYCSINRGTEHGGGTTRLGDDNWIMAYCHIAHDCLLGSNIVMANTCNLAGHVEVGDYVTLGGYTGIHQFCRVGNYSFSAIAAIIVKDVPPFVIVDGNTARARGLNRVGLKRNGFTPDEMADLKKLYRLFFRSGLGVDEALGQIASALGESGHAQRFIDFVRSSDRGVVR